MLDVETLGTNAGCVVWEIGAVLFSSKERRILDEWMCRISVEDALFHHLHIEEETRVWWEKKGGIRQDSAQPLAVALGGLKGILEVWQPKLVWARGIDFETAVLKAAFEAVGSELPWSFLKGCCQRTVTQLAGVPKTQETTHNALHDCRQQIGELFAAFELLQVQEPGVLKVEPQ